MRAINAYDIALRLDRQNRKYFHRGQPMISVIGKEKEFGFLEFKWNSGRIFFNIYLHDKLDIARKAGVAVILFSDIMNAHFKRMV